MILKQYYFDPKDRIGTGFSSTVYKGHHTITKLPVAVKEIDMKALKNPVQMRLLANEIRALKTLDHENIIKTHDICRTQTQIYFMTELCEHGDLKQYIEKNGRMEESEALRIFQCILSGILEIQKQGIVHRDVKSANVFMSGKTPKIGDFGFCQFISQMTGPQGYNVGSPLYMSPEAYLKTEYSSKSDLWAAGVILYEMLLGETPFEGLSYTSLLVEIENGNILKKIVCSIFTENLLRKIFRTKVQDRISIEESLLELRQYTSAKLTSPLVYSNLQLKSTEQKIIEPYSSPKIQQLTCNSISSNHSITSSKEMETERKTIFDHPREKAFSIISANKQNLPTVISRNRNQSNYQAVHSPLANRGNIPLQLKKNFIKPQGNIKIQDPRIVRILTLLKHLMLVMDTFSQRKDFTNESIRRAFIIVVKHIELLFENLKGFEINFEQQTVVNQITSHFIILKSKTKPLLTPVKHEQFNRFLSKFELTSIPRLTRACLTDIQREIIQRHQLNPYLDSQQALNSINIYTYMVQYLSMVDRKPSEQINVSKNNPWQKFNHWKLKCQSIFCC